MSCANTALIRKILGFIILLSVIYLVFSSIFTNSIAPTQPSAIDNKNQGRSLINELERPYPAPEIAGIDAWINSPSLALNELKGNVVLIDFWTYSCINCIRTLPYLTDWYAKYHDKGLVIIGVHSPEFQFEHDVANVKNAVMKNGIRYPVALDNKFATWQNYQNRYWPAHYLIDKQGQVVYQHFGEGEYEVTENNIQYLLGTDNQSTIINQTTTASMDQTPEIYLGYARLETFSVKNI